MINIANINKAAVLAALYNRSKTQGLGQHHYLPEDMTIEQAEQVLAQRTKFDYLQGRVMKVDLSGTEFDEWGYDRDNGQGAALRAIQSIKGN